MSALQIITAAAMAYTPNAIVPLQPGHSRRQLAFTAFAAPTPPPAVDNRRGGSPGAAKPEVTDKYGHDPRDGKEASEFQPDGSYVPPGAGSIGSIGSLGELQSALDAAQSDKQVVAIKFVRDGCLACASTASAYKSTAEQFGAKGQFYEIDFDQNKPFCRAAAVKFVPSGHIYANGKLVAALPLGKKAWDAFKERLDLTSSEV